MGSWADTMKRNINLYLDARLSPDQMGQVVASAAQANLQALIDQGIAPPTYATYVDGVEDADEADVKLDGGQIQYVFSGLREAAIYCYDFCQDSSPDAPTGDYKRAWMVVLDGVPWPNSLESIPLATQQVIIVNYAPYARKMETSFAKNHPADAVATAAGSATGQQYPGLRVINQYIDLPGGATGTVWPVPYVLKKKGGDVQYPAIIISQN